MYTVDKHKYLFIQLKEVEDYKRKEREQLVPKSNPSTPVKKLQVCEFLKCM